MKVPNRNSSSPRHPICSPGVILLLAGCVLLAAAGGVQLIYQKYRIEQVNVTIDEVNARIREHQNDIEMQKEYLSRITDRYALRLALEQLPMDESDIALAPRPSGQLDTLFVPDATPAPPIAARLSPPVK